MVMPLGRRSGTTDRSRDFHVRFPLRRKGGAHQFGPNQTYQLPEEQKTLIHLVSTRREKASAGHNGGYNLSLSLAAIAPGYRGLGLLRIRAFSSLISRALSCFQCIGHSYGRATGPLSVSVLCLFKQLGLWTMEVDYTCADRQDAI